STAALPLVSLSNQTSVQLLSADKSFKDFLTTQDTTRMNGMREEFAVSKQRFQTVLAELGQASVNHPALTQPITELKQL
ncbi:methyl-accepting chemotaxis protein, partial [Vibrio cholerae]|nr:methyl-accepting chemotaxis protein [Vibrio cholerae]